MKKINAELDTYLEDNKARLIRIEAFGNNEQLWWVVINGKLFLIQEYANNEGWDIFIPVDDSNRVDRTLKKLDQYVKK